MKEYTPMESLIQTHEDAKKGFKDKYVFDVKQWHIVFENTSSRDAWEKKRKRVENKIKRLHKEIKELEEEESIYSNNRDRFQAIIDAAIANEGQLRSIFDETN